MNIGKPRQLGKTLEELVIGQSISVTESIEDQQLLLFLGLTNDANPLYVQHDYAQKTNFKKPLVPPILLMGIITSTISKHLPGPGSQLLNLATDFCGPIYHEETVTFHFEISQIDLREKIITIDIKAHNEANLLVLTAQALVTPPIINKLV